MKNKKAKPLEPDEEIKKLGARLRYLRIKAGYTSAETFALDKGISRALYGRYERGKDLRYSSLIRLSNCFGMTVSELLSEEATDLK